MEDVGLPNGKTPTVAINAPIAIPAAAAIVEPMIPETILMFNKEGDGRTLTFHVSKFFGRETLCVEAEAGSGEFIAGADAEKLVGRASSKNWKKSLSCEWQGETMPMRRFLALVQPQEPQEPKARSPSPSAAEEPHPKVQRQREAPLQVDIRQTMAVSKLPPAPSNSREVVAKCPGDTAGVSGKERQRSRPNDCLVIVDPRRPPLQPLPSRQQQPSRRPASARKRQRRSDSGSADDSDGGDHTAEAATAAGGGAAQPSVAGSLPLDPALRLAISSLVAQVRPLLDDALREPLGELRALRLLQQREVGELRAQLVAQRGEMQALREAGAAQSAEQGRVVERLVGRVEEVERQARLTVCIQGGEAAAAARDEGRASSMGMVMAVRAAQAAWTEAFDRALAASD